MGKRHRLVRAETKKLAKRFGYKENEFGEVVRKVTKAEARFHFLRRITNLQLGQALVEIISEKVAADIDREIFEGIFAHAEDRL